MKARELQHLFNRVGFGIRPNELKKLENKSREKVVNTLFLESKKTTPIRIDLSFLQGLSRNDLRSKLRRKELMKTSRKKIVELNAAWLERLFNPTELLREKMTLFWANHFVCEDKNALHALQYHNVLRENALGNFKTFVKAISKEAAMIKYLNNKQNRKNSPNENFARELMELFTLGQGNYTENDIKESARAFTGYNHNFKGEFVLRRRQHDYDEKTFFGKTGNFDGDDIIDIILEEEQCARFISEKIYKYFVNDVVNEDHINQMVNVFYKDYDIEKLMRFVLSSDWFYSEENIGSKIKSPIEFLVGINTVVPYQFEKVKQSLLVQKLLGQILFKPPNVAGWKGGKNWIDSNTIVTRLRMPSVLLNNAEITYSDKGEFEDSFKDFSAKRQRKKAFIKTQTDWGVFDKNYRNSTNEGLISNIIIAPINSGTKEMLAETNEVSKRDFCVQLLSLPEYQLC